jgi:flagellin-like hook-associated protein FlgL
MSTTIRVRHRTHHSGAAPVPNRCERGAGRALLHQQHALRQARHRRRRGQEPSDIDVTKTGGAEEALKIIDAAIQQVSKLRGDMGAFQKNVLESNMRSLAVAKENLTATESAIRDTNFAEEISRFTKFQILQQAGMSVLGQANFAPQAVLQLIR